VARGVVEGFITGLHASPNKGFSVEFAEHRKYAPGDSPRHLDWRVLGRTDRLYIKQYEEETNLRAQILLDTSGSMAFGQSAAGTKLDYAAHLAAALAYLMIRQQDAVGLTTFDTAIRTDLAAGASPRHFDEMMRRLEAIRPGRETALGPTLHRLADRFKRRCLVILISDLHGDDESLQRALHHFRARRHEVIVFQVLDHAELDFPYQDTARFVDLETGEQIQVDPGFVRDAYLEEMEAFVQGCRRICAECAIDYVLADTAEPYDRLLSRYLVRRNEP
jgi:uncharacterized protein (DUF58 family)